jgi:hypothetical protein
MTASLFCGCKNLTEIELSKQLQGHEKMAFDACGLVQFDIPSSVVDIAGDAFSPTLMKLRVKPSTASLNTDKGSVLFNMNECQAIRLITQKKTIQMLLDLVEIGKLCFDSVLRIYPLEKKTYFFGKKMPITTKQENRSHRALAKSVR